MSLCSHRFANWPPGTQTALARTLRVMVGCCGKNSNDKQRRHKCAWELVICGFVEFHKQQITHFVVVLLSVLWALLIPEMVNMEICAFTKQCTFVIFAIIHVLICQFILFYSTRSFQSKELPRCWCKCYSCGAAMGNTGEKKRPHWHLCGGVLWEEYQWLVRE